MRQDTIDVSNTAAAAQALHIEASAGDSIAPRAPQVTHITADSLLTSEAETADTVDEHAPDSLPLLYLQSAANDSLLTNDSLLFRDPQASTAGRTGMDAQPLPPALFRNDGVSIALMGCFVLTLLFLAHSYRRLGQRIKLFFLPQQMATHSYSNEVSNYEWIHFLLGCQLSMIGSLLFYSYAQQALSADIINLTPLALVGIYAALILSMLVVKQRLYHFIHAIFFTPSARRRWYESFSLVFIFESLILFPLALLSVYFDLSLEKVAIILAFVLLFVKILLFFKCFSIFFVKLKGCLHLIVYFCALEILPLLLTWGILVEITRLFITIF